MGCEGPLMENYSFRRLFPEDDGEPGKMLEQKCNGIKTML